MSDLNDLLVDSLQDLFSAENQIVGALPKMVAAAHCEKLKEGFQKHLIQTQGQVERLKSALKILGESTDSKPCKGMKGILDEGEETIKDGEDQDELTSDLALIAAAQKVEHYEISGYKSAHCLAKQVNQREVSKLLAQTLGEEESTDYLLADLAKPLMQQASSVEVGNGTRAPWGEPGDTGATKPVMGQNKSVAVAGGGQSRFKVRKAKA
jgi:Mn-containing catalase